MINVLDTAYKIAHLANEEKIYDTSMNMKNIEVEMERIKNDPELRHLIPQQEGEENND